jgi:thiol:disulfide interchange protein DsbD
MAALAGAALFLGALAGSTNPWQPLAAFKNTGSTTAVANVTTFEKVTTLAELETRLANADRPVMLDFYADWCVSCQEMEHRTFADKNVQARLGQMDLLQVDVTDNSDHDKALLKRFQLFGPPATVLFAAGSNDALHRTVGFQSADVFSQMLDRVFFSTSK